MGRGTKTALLISVLLIVAGCGFVLFAFGNGGFDPKELDTNEYTEHSYVIEEPFNALSIETGDGNVRLIATQGEQYSVECMQSEKVYYNVLVKDDVLYIKYVDRRAWYEYIGLHLTEPKIVLHIPGGAYESLYIASQSGDIEVPAEFAFEEALVHSVSGDILYEAATEGHLKLGATSGNLHLKSFTVDSLEAHTTSGMIWLEDLNIKDELQTHNTSGDIYLSGVRCRQLQARNTSGLIRLENVIAVENITAHNTSGGILLEQCDAENLQLKTVSGIVRGTLLSKKRFFTDTVSGTVRVPYGTQGGLCEVETTSGNISFAIDE